ncbi:MAG: DUF6531 domain-containing protein, partial [Thermodesulfobacteriota bacterium]|nr:DUF6531 domain-containing protein [Thermodesulfobacteriota bacterium]
MGTVSVPAADVANWLGVHDTGLAAAVMNDQGIQYVAGPDADGYIQFEHVWVQVQLSYHNYRGAGRDAATDCGAEPGKCHWMSLDPSFKLKDSSDDFIDIYTAVPFDYDRYYNATKNDDADFRDKNPLEIYEEQILNYLAANNPGKTLDDVADRGTIIAVNDGILPASLPYEVVGTVETYDAVADHDAVAANKDWAKYLNGSMSILAQYVGGGTISITTGIGGPHALADLSTKRLTITYSSIDINGEADRVEVRLGGELVATPFVSSGSLLFPIGSPYSLNLTLDGAPATQAGQEDNQIEVAYHTLIVGGYYLIGTGGDVSNWSQVHRAADQLLAANAQYPIINDANHVPYVDQNHNGVIDIGEPPLLAAPGAQDALTGGLLYVAMSQYFAKFVDGLRTLDALNHVISPIEGFVGVVSSTYDVEYLGDGTAFSVMPGGLLIDMKGQQFSGAWRIDEQETTANEHFVLVGHMMSSLEHEIWQELTGYDAVSTVRGIQMALAGGAVSLLKPQDSGSGNNMAASYAGFGFNANPPSGFIYAPFDDIYGTRPAAWTHATTGAEMELMKKSVDASTSSTAKLVANYYYSPNQGLYAWCDCIDVNENQLEEWISQGYGNTDLGTQSVCNATLSGTVNQYLSQLQNYWFNTVIPSYIGQTYFNYFNRNNGFAPADYVYRGVPAATNMHDGVLVATIRNSVMLGTTGGRWEFVIPGRRTEGDMYRFTVYLEKIYDRSGGDLISQSYLIDNNSVATAGGGWVDGSQTVTLATSLPGTSVIAPTFNNEVFTDENLVAQTNNDLLRTPATNDPVSTVTGNMYHDETDLTLKGRGLDYVFTRSYNSAPARSEKDGPLGFGWTHSYNMSLRANDYGDCPNCAPGSGAGKAPENGNGKTASISYIDERGGEHTYLVNESTLAVTAPPGEFDQLQLDTPAAGQYTMLFRNGARYVFDGPADLKTVPGRTARLSYIEDPYGNRLTMAYDANGRLTGVSDNLGVSGRNGLTFTYSGGDLHIQSVSDWSGRVWSFGYDAAGNLVSVTNPLSQTTTYTYADSSHLLKDMVLPADRNGDHVTTTFAYYRNHKAFYYANQKGETETLDYDLYRQRTRVTDPRGFIREYQ